MKRKYYWIIYALLLAGNSHAQENHDPNPGGTTHSETKADEAKAQWTTGEVRKVEIAQKRITLKHGAIPNLGMDPMTMIFSVRNVQLLTGYKAGDKVRFRAEAEGDRLYITALEPQA